jgi:hypothetical protein
MSVPGTILANDQARRRFDAEDTGVGPPWA